MYLDKFEERMLEGELGEAVALAMRIVVKIAEIFSAERLVKIKHAHVSGVSYENIGDEGLEFLEGLAAKGGRFSVPTTVNPGAVDLELWRKMGVDESYVEKQLRIVGAFRRMGAKVTLTCTPYLYEDISPGDHLAWSESNAVLFANSVIGARTNRDGGPLALMEAIAGRAPLSGLHLDENRRPSLVVDFSESSRYIAENGLFSVAGLIVGRLAGNRVPLVRGLGLQRKDVEELKLFLAAVGATGGTGMVLIDGVSPEAPGDMPGEVEKIGVDDVKAELEKYGGSGWDAVVLGCPHLSYEEVASIIEWFERKGRPRSRVYLYTSREVASRLRSDRLEKLNIHLFADTCMVVSNLGAYASRSVATDSGKAAFYLASKGYSVALLPRRKLLEMLVQG
ncbi:aconitase X catalytic domain-containing protein [Thermofilum pendens]|uniref:Phosphomevalonate dehydratase large subunit n=1 Tax=Thermofilum pendens (strain DSM 2475 / Hrk 5) TaxID=368408 RepID=A1RYB8_THEPD|nr:aconitase X catalytic domain-containing protein [Thermofilum pendens]ABL78198.1 predicted aconitase subunit 1 [Thermofilum pendens Hrk 5]